MTGIGSDGTKTYIIGDRKSGSPLVGRYTTSGRGTTYISSFSGLTSHRDIAYEGGDGTGNIWIATSSASTPIKAYNTRGSLIQNIPGSVFPSGISAVGLCFNPSGDLWVSDDSNDKIYRISLAVGVEGPSGYSLEQPELTVSDNPFKGYVIISLNGFSNQANLAIYNLSGRMIRKEILASSHSFTWDGRTNSDQVVPAGIYMIQAVTSTGEVMRKLITKL